MNDVINRATVIGGGVIGSSWAALFLAAGLTVTICDPDPQIEAKARQIIEGAEPALMQLGFSLSGIWGRLHFEPDIAFAVAAADLVQECGPENVGFKRGLWKTIEASAASHALLLSSSSSLPASEQNAEMADRGRLLIGHPFNPPHLMPLIEVVPSPDTPADTLARVESFYRRLGKVPVTLKREVTGFVANRLQAAIFEECVFLVREGVVSIRDLDEIMTNSLGIRWATNGPFLSFHLGGGTGGMARFIEHLGKGPMEALWSRFEKVSFDEPTSELLIEQAALYYGRESIADLAAARDVTQVALLKAREAAAGLCPETENQVGNTGKRLQ